MTTPKTGAEMQEAFEAWAKDYRDEYIYNFDKNSDGTYYWSSTHHAWNLWQLKDKRISELEAERDAQIAAHNRTKDEYHARRERIRELEAARQWISVKDRLPECDMTPNSFGVQVLVWPPFESDGCSSMRVAFYGCRQTDKPNFYLFGRVFDPTHWMPLPKAPKDTDK